MNARTLCLLGLLALPGLCGAIEPPGSPEQLTYLTENYPPANYLVEGRVTGASVEILKLLWQRMGVAAQAIDVVPWGRGYRDALQVPGTVLFTMSRTPERESLFKWVGPIFSARQVVVAAPGFAAPIHTLGDLLAYSVATIRDDISEQAFRQAGFPEARMVRVTRVEQGVGMLRAGRVDLLLVSEELLQSLDAREALKVVWVVSEIGNYYAFHRATPDPLVARFQAAFDQISEQRAQVLAKYHISLPATPAAK